MVNATQERRAAMRCYHQGEAASAICRALDQTRAWFYQGLKRDAPATPL